MAQSKDKVPVSFKLDEDIRDMAAKVAAAKGIDLSEHIRSLVLQDLDQRGLLTVRIQKLQMQVSLSLNPGHNPNHGAPSIQAQPQPPSHA